MNNLISLNTYITINGAPIIFTERKDGVLPEYDIRTDRFDVAIDAMNVVNKTTLAKRMERLEAEDEKIKKLSKNDGNDGGTESTQGTNE